MPTLTLIDVPQDIIDEPIHKGMAEVIECEGTDGAKWDEYEISDTDYRKLLKLPYKLNKRSENGIWYLNWYADGKSHKISTELTNFSLAREKAKVIWKEYKDEIYAK